MHLPIDLTSAFNCRGIGPVQHHSDGFNVWRNTFPEDELPAPGSDVVIGGVEFRFRALPDDGGDNVRCRGQRLRLPPGRYDWLYLLGAAERRTEDPVHLGYADGTARRQWLRLSDFWPETPAWFGEVPAFRCTSLRYPRHRQARMGPTIWQQRVPVTVPGILTDLTLPDNPAMHIFALTLVREPEVTTDAG